MSNPAPPGRGVAPALAVSLLLSALVLSPAAAGASCTKMKERNGCKLSKATRYYRPDVDANIGREPLVKRFRVAFRVNNLRARCSDGKDAYVTGAADRISKKRLVVGRSYKLSSKRTFPRVYENPPKYATLSGRVKIGAKAAKVRLTYTIKGHRFDPTKAGEGPPFTCTVKKRLTIKRVS